MNTRFKLTSVDFTVIFIKKYILMDLVLFIVTKTLIKIQGDHMIFHIVDRCSAYTLSFERNTKAKSV